MLKIVFGLVRVREWKMLSLYMFHRIIFILLIVGSLIAVPFVLSRSVYIACRSTQNAARIKRFRRLHIDKAFK